MSEKSVRQTLQVIDLTWSIGLFLFFCYQKLFKKRCKFEVLYVTGVGTITDFIKLTYSDVTPGSITIQENNIEFNWSQYYGWLVTCPVLLIHLSNLEGKDVFNVRRMMKILVAYQILMVSGATASMYETEYVFKWIFFSMSVTLLSSIFYMAKGIFQEALLVMPKTARLSLIRLAVVFYSSWAGFGLFWFVSPSGIGLISTEVSKAGFAFCDILSKNVYSIQGWYLRWYILRKFKKPEEFVNQVDDNVDMNEDIKVLIVDMNVVVAHYLSNILSQYSCDTKSVATNLHEVFAKISQTKFDIIFVNIEFAEMNNYQLMFSIRQQLFLTPVIAYGTQIHDYHMNNRSISGIDDFLTIPIPEDHLHKVVTRWSRRASVNPHLMIEKKVSNTVDKELRVEEEHSTLTLQNLSSKFDNLLKMVEDLKTQKNSNYNYTNTTTNPQMNTYYSNGSFTNNTYDYI